jgi:glyoxylase-like metal-dependent hydrolase (beta-lactamase superfamily II)
MVTALTLLGSLSALSDSADAAAFDIEFEELAPGVWAGIRPDAPRFPVMGTSVFVIGEEGVVVFDGGGVPVMAEKVIDKIRSLTNAPVTQVVISHWHGDHNFGIHRFAEEFPNVQFIAHRFTHAVMNASRIRYIDNYPNFIENNLPVAKEILATGLTQNGDPVSLTDRKEYERMVEDAEEIDVEYKRARVTSPNVVFDESLRIYLGDKPIELLKLGHGNTEGDIVMWLPNEKIVATGDIVVMPSPYAFNVPPRPWAATLKKINELNYEILVPGHGAIQRDTRYVDLIIEASESIADQRDAMVAQGMSHDEIQEQLDFHDFEERFTGGDEYLSGYYTDYFERPFRAAATKALTGEPMVTIERPE